MDHGTLQDLAHFASQALEAASFAVILGAVGVVVGTYLLLLAPAQIQSQGLAPALPPQAEALLKDAVEVGTRKLGPNDPTTLTAKHSLAGIYQAQKKYGEAATLYKEVLDNSVTKLGADHHDRLTGSLAARTGCDVQVESRPAAGRQLTNAAVSQTGTASARV